MKSIYKSLADFQNECPTILKDTQGYGYVYADLPAIYEVIMPLLKKHGLGFTQLLENTGMKTILFHIESGETLESYTEIPQGVELAKMNAYQVMGSAYSYYRRYALSAMLGVITDKDTDATAPVEKYTPSPELSPYEKAKKVITISRDIDKLIELSENIDKSDKFTEIQKAELVNGINSRVDLLNIKNNK